jgi:hypothetical protein
MGTLIPNSFQHPNVYVDRLSYYLTPAEEKVLNKAIREIYGWQDKIASRRAKISLSVFTDGKRAEDGTILCYGCGLSTQTVRSALDGLHKFGILVKVGRPSKYGQMFEIQDDVDSIDWTGLESRKAEQYEKIVERTEVALAASRKARGMNDTIMGPARCKQYVMERDNYTCRYCGEPGNVVDHVIPVAKGGGTSPENCVTACPKCNGKKQCRTPDEAGMIILPILLAEGVRDVRYGTSTVLADIGSGTSTDIGSGTSTTGNKETQETQLETHTAQVAPGAPTGEKKSRKSTGKQKMKDPPHKAIMVFRSNTNYYPPKAWYPDIMDTVGTDPANLEFWGKVIKQWVGLGWKPTNVSGMLDHYKCRKLPGDDFGNGKSPPPAQSTVRGI